jgi:hypothetical protein
MLNYTEFIVSWRQLILTLPIHISDTKRDITCTILLRTVEVPVRVSAGRPIILIEDPLDIPQVLYATDGTMRIVEQDGFFSHGLYSVLRGHVSASTRKQTVRAMAQTVSSRPGNSEDLVQPMASTCGVAAERVALWQVLLRVLLLCPVSTTSSVFHVHSFIADCILSQHLTASPQTLLNIK